MKRALDSVNEKILAAVKRRPTGIIVANQLPRLVAVSKLKPASAIIEAYDCGQRYFGENYIQELEEKSNSQEIVEKCPDIKFHFIGHLQSNKVNRLLRVRNLHMMESVDSIKLASAIDKAIGRHQSGGELAAPESSSDEATNNSNRPDLGDELRPSNRMNGQLNVMIQVNTSGEDQKNGIQPQEAPHLAEHIVEKCRRLRLAGLMTIGKFEGWGDGPNQDFLRLYELREIISKKLSIEAQSLELSMGMSGDFEEAIELGSTNVRVGTMIFGERAPKNPATATTTTQ